jgi:cytochrome bd-type quinol oxidase subunit 2
MKTRLMTMANKVLLLVMVMFANLGAFAQTEVGGNVVSKTTTTSQQWYTSPWAWIIGAAVFILLFAAILRGNRTDA